MKKEIKDVWENGHHKRIIIDVNTGTVLADAYESYRIPHSEYIIRMQCRKALLIALKSLFGKVITNFDSNIKARFSKNTANKIVSDKAITKSVVNGFSPQEHFEAAENIRGIFEQSEYIGNFSDDTNDSNILAIHRFQKNIILSNGRECVAYITLKEVKKEGSRIYTQELLLKKYPLQKAGELTSRGSIRSETIAYKCNPRTDYNIIHKILDVNEK